MVNCFELFGLDFMIDSDYNVQFLEANPGPDFKQTGDRLKLVIDSLWQETIEIALKKNTSACTNFVKVYSKEWSVSHLKGSGMSLV